MSVLRPTLGSAGKSPVMKGGTAYLMILNAVEHQPGLLHGRLKQGGEYCAIGSYFQVNPEAALPTDIVDEVAAVNDSMPYCTPRIRKQRMMRWLKWKLKTLGVPGYERANK